MIAFLKKEIFYLSVALVALVSTSVFKINTENEFSRIDTTVLKMQRDILLNHPVEDASDEFIIFTYFDREMTDELAEISSLTTDSDSGAEREMAAEKFTASVNNAERRIRFGFDSVVYTSLALIIISFVMIMYKNMMQKAEIEKLTAKQEVQKQLSRDLHDGAAQSLAALRIELRDRNYERALYFTDETIKEVRWLIGTFRFDLTAPFPDIVSQCARAFEESRHIPVVIHDTSDLPPSLSNYRKLELMRIVQECLANIAHHADATSVTILLSGARMLTISIADNGKGFDQDSIDNGQSKHIGLQSMKERAEQLGGTFRISSDNGVTIVVTVPTGEAL